MKIAQLLTPMSDVQWLSVTDTVQDAFDHMETYEVTAAPLLDWDGRYVGTVTEADLRRHVAVAVGRAAFATPLVEVERRSHNTAVAIDRDVRSVVDHALMHRFVPVVDGCGKLVGIVDRRRILDAPLPRAA
jgi:CBS domain-containing protein